MYLQIKNKNMNKKRWIFIRWNFQGAGVFLSKQGENFQGVAVYLVEEY